MTAVPNGAQPLEREELKRLLPTHPGVVRRRVRPVACDGLVTGRFSFKKRRENRLVGCKNPAYWRFHYLRTWPRKSGVTENLCWSHLMHRAVFGSMAETDRTYTWLRRLGYRTEPYWTKNDAHEEEKD